MNPSWFDETTYLVNKLHQLQRAGENFITVAQVKNAINAAGMTAFDHYKAYGDSEGVNPNVNFNRVEYLEAKAAQLNSTKFQGKSSWDVATTAKVLKDAGYTAAEHFAAWGWQENLNPSNTFDVSSYLADKVNQLHGQPGTDHLGIPYSQYTVVALKSLLTTIGMDPLSHFDLYGKKEGLVNSDVPENEQVPPDPQRPSAPVLSADGKTITVHLESPIKAATIEAADFTVWLGEQELKVTSVAPGADKVNYNLILTLADTSRVPGLIEGQTSTPNVVYNPNGGATVALETDDGPVAPFDWSVENRSQCFNIVERVEVEANNATNVILKVSIAAPVGYVPPTEVSKFVKVDLAATKGVVTGGEWGIVTPPRLMDGKAVHTLDASGVDDAVSLDIKTGPGGHTIITGNAADKIAFGAGADVLEFHGLITSQLQHMDTVDKFTYNSDKLFFAKADDHTAAIVDKVLYKGPLSLEGEATEAAIQGIFNNTPMETGTAYLLQLVAGKDYLIVADSDADGKFTTNDFALSLTGVTGFAADLVPGADLSPLLSNYTPTP